MIWRFLKGKRTSTDVVREAPASRVGTSVLLEPDPTAEDLDTIAEKATEYDGDTLVDGSEMEPPEPDLASVVRSKTPPRRGVRVASRGVRPLLVPSLRKPALIYRVGAESRWQSGLREAPDLWRAYLSLRPDDARGLFDYGQVCLMLGELELARTAFERVVELDKGDALVFGALGFVAGKQLRTHEAVTWFEKAVGADPASRDMLHGLVAAYRAGGREEDASHVEQQLVDLDELEADV